MEDPQLRPIPEHERPTVLALLRAMYAGETEKIGPGMAPSPTPIAPQGAIALVRSA